MKFSGVYKIDSIINPERCYIGSAKDIYKRWEQHLRTLRNNKHHSRKLQRHYNKYGKNDLIFSILIGCDESDLLTTEQYFIDSYNPYFNGSNKAINNGGFKLTEEQRKKISEAFMGENNPNYGKHFSEEHRRKLSEAKKGISVNKGRKHSEEAKKKISEARKGKPNPHKGYPLSDSAKKKLSDFFKGRIPWNKGKKNPHKGVPHSEEHKRKIGESQRGRTHSPETKEKMSKSRKEYYRLKRMEFSSN